MNIKRQDNLIIISSRKNKRFLEIINENLFRIFYVKNDISLFDINEKIQPCAISIQRNKILIND